METQVFTQLNRCLDISVSVDFLRGQTIVTPLIFAAISIIVFFPDPLFPMYIQLLKATSCTLSTLHRCEMMNLGSMYFSSIFFTYYSNLICSCTRSVDSCLYSPSMTLEKITGWFFLLTLSNSIEYFLLKLSLKCLKKQVLVFSRT